MDKIKYKDKNKNKCILQFIMEELFCVIYMIEILTLNSLFLEKKRTRLESNRLP